MQKEAVKVIMRLEYLPCGEELKSLGLNPKLVNLREDLPNSMRVKLIMAHFCESPLSITKNGSEPLELFSSRK